jgi:hypothetical protein
MAIVTIQHRRGEYADYDPSKVLPGELVVTQTGDPNTTDGEAAYIATRAGSVKRIPFASEVEDLKTEMDDVVEDAREAIESAIDPTLKQSGKAADAKKTGDEIADLKSDLENLESGLSDEAKEAILTCFEHIALWDDDKGADYIASLRDALYPAEYPKVVAQFTQGSHVVYNTDTLDSLKPYLTVIYYATESSTGTTITDYTLSGSLADAVSYITVSYNNLTTRFAVNVIDVDNIMEWNYPSDITDVEVGTVERNSSSDIRAVINPATTSRRVIGNTLTTPKIMNKSFVSLAIAPIQLPEGTTGATVTFSVSGTDDVKYMFARLSKTDDYYNVITWTAQMNSGERTSFANSNQVVLLIITSTTGEAPYVNNVKIVFDKNA